MNLSECYGNRIEHEIQKFSSLKYLSTQSNQKIPKKKFSGNLKQKIYNKRENKSDKAVPKTKEKHGSESDNEEILEKIDERDIVPDLDSDIDDASLHEDIRSDNQDDVNESSENDNQDNVNESSENDNQDDVNESSENDNQDDVNDSSENEEDDYSVGEANDDFSGDDVLFGGQEPDDDNDDDDDDAMEMEDDVSNVEESDEEAKFLTEDKDIDEKEANLMFDDFFEPPPEQSKSGKSKFELSQEKLQEEIEKLEDMMMDEKPWRLRGEIDAADRNENALLEEDLDTQYAALEKPEVSEDVETNLLNLIKTKIKSRNFDNVERKTKQQIQDERGYRKLLELNTEKPKPLHEVYEEDYHKKNSALLEENEDPQKEEIRKEMNSLFENLDALSSLHFVPKATLPEIKIVHQLPATQIEEAAPVTVNTVDLLAPEEVLANPSRPLVGQSEMTQTDRKRKRRKIKKHFHEKKIARIEKFGKSPKDNTNDKNTAMKKVLKMAHKPNSNVKIVR